MSIILDKTGKDVRKQFIRAKLLSDWEDEIMSGFLELQGKMTVSSIFSLVQIIIPI